MTDEEAECLLEALKADWLKTNDEIASYAGALLAAKKWGEKIDKENEEYRKKHNLKGKYR